VGSAVALALVSTVACIADANKAIYRAQIPPWVMAGQTTQVTLIGTDLDGKELRFSDGRLTGKILKVEPSAPKSDEARRWGNKAVDVEVTTPAGLKPGLYPFELFGENGAKTDGRLLIDVAAPEVTEKEPNGSLLQPQVLPEGSVTVNGKLDGDGADVFQIQGKAGETWRFEIFARRLAPATKFEPVLRLRGPRREPLRAAVDHGRDCAIEMKLPEEGRYLIEVFDGNNASGGDFTYRLAVRRL
jgi:hypothetical protein